MGWTARDIIGQVEPKTQSLTSRKIYNFSLSLMLDRKSRFNLISSAMAAGYPQGLILHRGKFNWVGMGIQTRASLATGQRQYYWTIRLPAHFLHYWPPYPGGLLVCWRQTSFIFPGGFFSMEICWNMIKPAETKQELCFPGRPHSRSLLMTNMSYLYSDDLFQVWWSTMRVWLLWWYIELW